MNKILPSLSFYLFLSFVFFHGNLLQAQSIQLSSLTSLSNLEGRGFTYPTFSPDGTRLAFTTSGRSGLFTYQFSNESIAQVSDMDGLGSSFSWTPDGEHLLARHTQRNELFNQHAAVLLPVSGAPPIYLTDFVASMPQYPKTLTTTGDVLVNVKRQPQRISTQVLGKAVTTESRYVASASNSTLHIYKEGDRLETFQAASDILNESISQNGEWVVFERLGLTTILKSLRTKEEIDLGFVHRPVLSPNGRFIAGMVTQDDGYAFTSSDIVIIDTETLDEVNLTSSEGLMGMNPDWSPDGLQLVFEDFASGSIYLATFTLN